MGKVISLGWASNPIHTSIGARITVAPTTSDMPASVPLPRTKPEYRKRKKMIDELTRKGLLDYIKPRFKLRWDGAHGISHWRRVESNGLLLCEKTKANPRVIALFSLLHDACLLAPAEN
jgi:hypothetical protein